jgi:hypothetical protein
MPVLPYLIRRGRSTKRRDVTDGHGGRGEPPADYSAGRRTMARGRPPPPGLVDYGRATLRALRIHCVRQLRASLQARMVRWSACRGCQNCKRHHVPIGNLGTSIDYPILRLAITHLKTVDDACQRLDLVKGTSRATCGSSRGCNGRARS